MNDMNTNDNILSTATSLELSSDYFFLNEKELSKENVRNCFFDLIQM